MRASRRRPSWCASDGESGGLSFLGGSSFPSQEVRDINPDAIVVRPAPLFGAEDKLTNAYGILLRYWSRTIPMIVGSGWHMEPVFVGDAARSIVQVCFLSLSTLFPCVSLLTTAQHVRDYRGSLGRTVEVVGPDRFNHEELCELVAKLCILDGRYRRLPIPPVVAERVLRLTDRMPRFRPMWSAEDVLMRTGRDACASPAAPGVVVETGTQTIEASGLLWLRRFREARSMNQVHGRRGDDEFVHPYITRSSELDRRGD